MKFFPVDSRFPWRCVRRYSLLLVVLLLLPLVSSAQDSPSGFFPGTITELSGGSTGLNLPTYVSSVAVDSKGNIYIGALSPTNGSDSVLYMVYGGQTPVPPILAAVVSGSPQQGAIYKLSADQNCTSGTCGDGGTLDQAYFASITNLFIDQSDNLYITDASASIIREVNYTSKIITTIAGQSFNPTSSGATNLGDPQQASTATLQAPSDAKVDGAGNLYIADNGNNVVRVVYNVNNLATGAKVPPLLSLALSGATSQQGYIYTIAGEPGVACTTAGQCGDNSAASSASFGSLYSLDIDSAGNLYILDLGNNISPTVKLVPAVVAAGSAPPLLSTVSLPQGQSLTAGNIYVIAGSEAAACSASPCGDGSKALQAQFSYPLYLRIDASGDVYVDDLGANAIRKVDAAGYISSIAGVENPGGSDVSTGSGGLAVNAYLYSPYFNAQNNTNAETNLGVQNNLYVITTESTTASNLWQVAPATPQAITFPALETSATYGNSPIALDATANSGLEAHYFVTGPGKIICADSSTPQLDTFGASYCPGVSAELKFTGAGSVAVTASQPGGTVTAGSSTVVYAPATAASGTTLAQTITVGKAPLTITANSFQVNYGKFDPTVAGFYSANCNCVNGDSVATAFTGGSLSFSTTPTVTAISPQGTYTINVSPNGLTSDNYDVKDATYISGTLTITGNTPQTIQNFTAFTPVTYGQVTTINLASLGVTATSGGPVTFTVASSDPGNISNSTLTITGAGTIHVTASQSGYEQYEAAPTVTQNLVVNPAPLTVTAPNLSSPYPTVINAATLAQMATANPPTIKGLLSSDAGKWICSNACYTTNASGTPDASSTGYTLSVVPADLTLNSSIASNYTFATFNAGSLTIIPGSQTITFSALPTVMTYGDSVTLTPTASSGLPVTLTLTGPGKFNNSASVVTVLANTAATYEATGTGTITIIASQAGSTANNDYLAALSVSHTQIINPATLLVTATSYTREYGAANPTLVYGFPSSANYGVGFQNGDSDIPSVLTGVPTLTTTATSASPAGTYPIVITQGTLAALPLASPNYTFQFVTGTLTVLPAGSYTITTNPSSLTIARGQSAQSIVTITPSNLYQGTVTLSCGQLPANVTCTISPATYTFPGNQTGENPSENSAMGTITINTTSATVVGSNAQKSNVSLAGVLIPGALAGLFLFFARKRVARIATFWSLCALLALGVGTTLGLTSCGGSNVSTIAAAGTQTITITGSGTTPSGTGMVTATVPLTVTIQ